jgi:hypothetical protein
VRILDFSEICVVSLSKFRSWLCFDIRQKRQANIIDEVEGKCSN